MAPLQYVHAISSFCDDGPKTSFRITGSLVLTPYFGRVTRMRRTAISAHRRRYDRVMCASEGE